MAVYNGPPRGGSRGGRDQFNWDAVKGDKDREYYLGHSVKALAGRWQKGKDVYWYTREKERDQSAVAVDHELQAVKDKEAQLMAENVECSRAMGGMPAAHERLPADGLPGAASQPPPEDLPGPPPLGSPRASNKRRRAEDDSPRRSTKRRSEHSSKKSKKDKREKKEKKHKRDKKHSRDKKRSKRSESR